MQVEIFTPDKEIFTGKASLIQLWGLDGLFEILDNHAPMIAALKAGQIKVCDEQNQNRHFDIKGGVVEVNQNRVLVLAE